MQFSCSSLFWTINPPFSLQFVLHASTSFVNNIMFKYAMPQ